jgi:hypothetical protein
MDPYTTAPYVFRFLGFIFLPLLAILPCSVAFCRPADLVLHPGITDACSVFLATSRDDGSVVVVVVEEEEEEE